MAALNLIKTFENIKDKFNDIKTVEQFAMDPLYNYDPWDLTSYDERREIYNDELRYKNKRETRNRFFDHLDKKKEEKCDPTDIMDRNCYKELKDAIWVLIIVLIILTVIFVIFIISKLFFGHSSSQPVQQQVQQVQQPAQPGQKRNFFDRFLGSKPEAPQEQAPQPKADFISRFLGTKPKPESA